MTNIIASTPANVVVDAPAIVADANTTVLHDISAVASATATTTNASGSPQSSAKLLKPVMTVEAAHADSEQIATRTRDEFVSLFRACEEKTARATLEMCRSVYEAHKVLNEAEFDAFCREIGYKDTSSSIRKFIAIGKVMPRLIQFAEKLPASWTNIYMLTQIPASTFEAMIKQDRSFRNIKSSHLAALVKETRDNNSITGHLPLDR